MGRVIKLALLGKELRYSVSPQLHSMMFPIVASQYFPEYRDSSIRYDLVELGQECEVAQWLKTAESNGYVGANVTMPYKSLLARLATGLSNEANLSGSVNTLQFGDEKCIGASTDGSGLLNAIGREWKGVDLSSFDWTIFGSGGAAAAILFRLAEEFHPESITISARSTEHGADLAERLTATFPDLRLLVVEFPDIPRQSDRPHLIIQATSLGQRGAEKMPELDFDWHPEDAAIDVVFNPSETPFLRLAARNGAKTLNGLGMLVEQAALSQCFWFGNSLRTESPLADADYYSLMKALSDQIEKH